ncbi:MULTISPECIES: STAS domain-containing protein [unclassified Micromonospora]|uniref:STAS domain-containing protein n=1 Tax=unclassified Micromonospora TaxID=2617518 RepID=UPI001C218A17|nr:MULTISPECIES: STAS domain-containing protein [unclassified Micromonospora]MBU8860625.1 STAS domain-containing protein [Micromonospora sp. WMMB482]MDM4780164.1 STAS domain-containing protein [Micromonospora sp. b486]
MDRSDPAVPVVAVGGDLAYATAGPLRAEIDRLLAGYPTTLVFDFGDLQFMDSTGLSVIVHAWREGQQAGTAIELRAVPRFLETILDLTGVTGLLDRSPVDDAAGQPVPGSTASA